MALLEVKGLTMRLGGLTAVNKVDFAVEKGQVFSVIGPSGAGKTTVFNAVTGTSDRRRSSRGTTSGGRSPGDHGIAPSPSPGSPSPPVPPTSTGLACTVVSTRRTPASRSPGQGVS